MKTLISMIFIPKTKIPFKIINVIKNYSSIMMNRLYYKRLSVSILRNVIIFTNTF